MIYPSQPNRSEGVKQLNNSSAFSTGQAFFIAIEAIEVIIPLTFLARTGHNDTHLMQNMHLLLSFKNKKWKFQLYLIKTQITHQLLDVHCFAKYLFRTVLCILSAYRAI